MRTRPAHLALACAIPLIGCGAVPVQPATPVIPALTGNWHIQTTNSITVPAEGQVFMAGALQVSGSQATASFLTQSICSSEQVAPFTGSFDASTGTLTLATGPGPVGRIQVQLAILADPTDPSLGTATAAGALCNLAFSSQPVIGIEIPQLTATFSGTLTTTAPSAPPSGTVTLTVAQSTTPDANGQFPLIANLVFAATSCGNFSTPLTGTIAGAGFSLVSPPAGSPSLSAVVLSGADIHRGIALSSVTLSFAAGPCNSGAADLYTGTLTLQ